MYDANVFCEGQYWRSRGWESATSVRLAEIDWCSPDCAQLVADEVCNDVPAE